MAFQPFTLPNGSTIKNRIVKAAMEENMADVRNGNQASESLLQLYRTWGAGGAGVILSGHVMIDPRALACPGDVLLADDAPTCDEQLWKSWAASAQSHGAQFWLQLNHPGRQVKAGSGLPVYAPSPIPVDIGKFSNAFVKPVEMDEQQIHRVIERFAWAARKAEQLGFAGVEIHAAHGYLISSFLSPRSNGRTDRWGGSRENRARLLLEVVQAVKDSTSPRFGVAVKINTSDFQRGGFGPEDLEWVVRQLNEMKLDFLELSGGRV
ncbi:NADH-dependent flavin oxidoreductase [Fulvia fulva]|uniref:NADH-dependent flavin oxidoreductase n=1 Tax=Passalora fulva TaxID=5499 RepID=A0A9Q8PLX0_PASFU|nr:NADH-dependent flavin oxidoreductase [Fulvia fulva]UJO24842.1 NADH-dependent flavin oxidoreductase [Fulvia fulva]